MFLIKKIMKNHVHFLNSQMSIAKFVPGMRTAFFPTESSVEKMFCRTKKKKNKTHLGCMLHYVGLFGMHAIGWISPSCGEERKIEWWGKCYSLCLKLCLRLWAREIYCRNFSCISFGIEHSVTFRWKTIEQRNDTQCNKPNKTKKWTK